MKKYLIKDLVDEISVRIDDPKTSGIERFVGLEHYDSGEVEVKRFGSTANLDSTMKVFKSGDILIARRNVYLRRAGIVYFDGLTSGDSIVLRPKNRRFQMILPFIFNTDKFWDFATQFSDGSMSKRLSPKTLMEYEVFLPEEQGELEKISTLLWSFTKTLNSYKKLIVCSSELLKARFVELFKNTKNVKLGKCIEQIRGVSYKPIDLGEAEDNEHVILLRANNILNNEINFDDLQFVSKEKIQNNQLIRKGDILVCASSGSKEHDGKAALCKFDRTATFGAFCKLIRTKNGLSPILLSEFFRSDEYRNYINQIACGSNINNLRNEHFDNLEIPFPNKDEQARFDDFVMKVNTSIENARKCFSKLHAAFQSILNKSFNEEE